MTGLSKTFWKAATTSGSDRSCVGLSPLFLSPKFRATEQSFYENPSMRIATKKDFASLSKRTLVFVQFAIQSKATEILRVLIYWMGPFDTPLLCNLLIKNENSIDPITHLSICNCFMEKGRNGTSVWNNSTEESLKLLHRQVVETMSTRTGI